MSDDLTLHFPCTNYAAAWKIVICIMWHMDNKKAP